MQLNEEKIVKKFKKIKSKNPHPTQYPQNKDGGAGNTLEELLGVRENNKKKPDYLNFECKTYRRNSSANISLASKVPTEFEGSQRYLWEKFGRKDDKGLNRFYATIPGNEKGKKKKWTKVYKKIKMRIQIDREKEEIRVFIKNLNDKIILDNIFWTFKDIKKSIEKLNDMLVAEVVEIKKKYFSYNRADLFWNFNFDRFLEEIENDMILLDIRCGVHKSKEKLGQLHDRGPAWRLRKRYWKDTMKRITENHTFIE